MNIRMFILAVIIIVPVCLFNMSCEKEQPVPEDVALEQAVQESIGEEPEPSGVVHDEYEEEADEAVGDELDEEEGTEEDFDDELDEEEDDEDDDYEDEDEDVNDELYEEEGEPEE